MANVLVGLGRWAVIAAVDSDRWLELITRTLEVTGGSIELATVTAERCSKTPPSERVFSVLRTLLDGEQPWERDYVARLAVQTIAEAHQHRGNREYERLRTRLIDLGHHDA